MSHSQSSTLSTLPLGKVQTDEALITGTTPTTRNEAKPKDASATPNEVKPGNGVKNSGNKPSTGNGSATKRNLTKLSHRLSLGLRHKAVEFGWHIAPDGFVPVQEVLDHTMFQSYNLRDITEVVQSNDKQRYTLQERPLENYYKESTSSRDSMIDHGDRPDVIRRSDGLSSGNKAKATILCIRANQGHSITVINPDLLLERLTSDDLLQNYPTMVHGTYLKSWECIQSSGGLSKMKRNHIHFATGIPNAHGRNETVISGMRKSCDVYIYVNVRKCVLDNIAIYKSDNGVLLTAGVDDLGILPMQYFSRVTDASGNVLLQND